MINVTRQQTVSYIIEPGPGVGLAPFALPEERAIALRDKLNEATGHDSTFADIEVKRLRAEVTQLRGDLNRVLDEQQRTREEWAREAAERLVEVGKTHELSVHVLGALWATSAGESDIARFRERVAKAILGRDL